MRVFIKKSTYFLCAIFVLLSFQSTFADEPILPAGLIMDNIYKPGIGAPVGKVQLAQGKVVIMHTDLKRGFWAKKDLLLYKGDTIVTKDKARIRFKLNDGSILTLASRTKLTINRSVYNPVKKRRSSFFSMAIGKARFWAKKFVDFKRSEFKVKTPTAVTGVRGSDFVLRVTMDLTVVTALEDTRLELISNAFPELKPVLLNDFERTRVRISTPPSMVIRVSPEEIEKLKKDFTISQDRVEPGVRMEQRKKKEVKKEPEVKSEVKGEVKGSVTVEGKAETRGVVAVEGEAETQGIIAVEGEEAAIIILDDELVEPEDLGEREELEKPLMLDIIEREEIFELVEDVRETQEIIHEAQQEDIVAQEQEATELIIQELPSLPSTPQ